MSTTRIAAAGVAFTAAAAALVVAPSAAGALPRDHQNPIGTVCMKDVRTVRSAAIREPSGKRVGTVNLRYSPRCKTAWAQTISFIPYDPGDKGGATAKVVRTADGANSHRMSGARGQRKVWSNMLNDDGYTSYAVGTVDSGAARDYSAATGSY